MARKYKILHPTGVYYPDPAKPGSEKHAKFGEVVDDLPSTSTKDLQTQGSIELVGDDTVPPATVAG